MGDHDESAQGCAGCDLELCVLTSGVALLSLGERRVQLREAQVKRLAQMLGEALVAMQGDRVATSAGYLH